MNAEEIESTLAAEVMQEKALVAEAILEGKHESALRASRVPKRYWGKSIATTEKRGGYPLSSILAACDAGSAFICGHPGVGKTHAAVLALNAWLSKYHPFLWMESGIDVSPPPDMPVFALPGEIMMKVKASWGNTKTSELEILAEYLDAPLLVLDDIGAYKNSSWSKDLLYAIIDHRYNNEANIIVTSNLSLDGIGRVIDDRLASRLSEMCAVINVTASDYRLNGSKVKGGADVSKQ